MKNTSKKRQAYLHYLYEHKANIERAWTELQDKLHGKYWIDDYLWHTINHQIRTHDASKYTPEEFEPYRTNFFPTEEEKKNNENHSCFDRAWLNHIKNNPHHWEHWVIPGTKNKALPMDFPHLIEMLLDWKAVSYMKGDSPSELFEKREKDMILHPATRGVIKSWLPLFEEPEEEDNTIQVYTLDKEKQSYRQESETATDSKPEGSGW